MKSDVESSAKSTIFSHHPNGALCGRQTIKYPSMKIGELQKLIETTEQEFDDGT